MGVELTLLLHLFCLVHELVIINKLTFLVIVILLRQQLTCRTFPSSDKHLNAAFLSDSGVSHLGRRIDQ